MLRYFVSLRRRKRPRPRLPFLRPSIIRRTADVDGHEDNDAKGVRLGEGSVPSYTPNQLPYFPA